MLLIDVVLPFMSFRVIEGTAEPISIGHILSADGANCAKVVVVNRSAEISVAIFLMSMFKFGCRLPIYNSHLQT